MANKQKSKLATFFSKILKPFKAYHLKLKNKNWKADRQAWKNKWIARYKKAKPYTIIFAWYTILLYLLTGFLWRDYSLKTVGFAFALYMLYEKLRDDYIEVLEVKSIHNKENDK